MALDQTQPENTAKWESSTKKMLITMATGTLKLGNPNAADTTVNMNSNTIRTIVKSEREFAQTKLATEENANVIQTPYNQIQDSLSKLGLTKKTRDAHERFSNEFLPLKDEATTLNRFLEKSSDQLNTLIQKKEDVLNKLRRGEISESQGVSLIKTIDKDKNELKKDLDKWKVNAENLAQKMETLSSKASAESSKISKKVKKTSVEDTSKRNV